MIAQINGMNTTASTTRKLECTQYSTMTDLDRESEFLEGNKKFTEEGLGDATEIRDKGSMSE